MHADATHPRFDQFITTCQQKMAQRLPDANLSVNLNLDHTQALVKVSAVPLDINNLPPVVRNAVIRIYTEADHHEALAMVTSVAWAGPEPA